MQVTACEIKAKALGGLLDNGRLIRVQDRQAQLGACPIDLVEQCQVIATNLRVATILDALVDVPPYVAVAHEQLCMLLAVVGA